MRLTIAQKLLAGFGVMFLLVLFLTVNNNRGITEIHKKQDSLLKLTELETDLKEMQVVHYKWVASLKDAVRHKNKEKFQGSLDPTRCGFGKWYLFI